MGSFIWTVMTACSFAVVMSVPLSNQSHGRQKRQGSQMDPLMRAACENVTSATNSIAKHPYACGSYLQTQNILISGFCDKQLHNYETQQARGLTLRPAEKEGLFFGPRPVIAKAVCTLFRNMLMVYEDETFRCYRDKPFQERFSLQYCHVGPECFNGSYSEIDCPGNMLFNAKKNTCDFRRLVKCTVIDGIVADPTDPNFGPEIPVHVEHPPLTKKA